MELQPLANGDLTLDVPGRAGQETEGSDRDPDTQVPQCNNKKIGISASAIAAILLLLLLLLLIVPVSLHFSNGKVGKIFCPLSKGPHTPSDPLGWRCCQASGSFPDIPTYGDPLCRKSIRLYLAPT
ncbi:hypothetical protein XENTR_v10015207 [Xenopus tropicalis]|nr:hypothetical protein XENTR_v10015207 [Xenopus tropicalis]